MTSANRFALPSPPEAIQPLVDIAADLWRTQLRRAAISEEIVLYEQAQEILTRAVCAWAGVLAGG